MKIIIKIESILAFSDYQDSDARNKMNKGSIMSSTEDRQLYIDTLNWEINSAVMDNYDLDYRKNNRWLFRTIKTPPQITKSMLFETRITLQPIVCPLRPWWKKISRGYGEKDLYLLMLHFGILRLSEFWFEEHNKWLPTGFPVHNQIFSDWLFEGRIQTCS